MQINQSIKHLTQQSARYNTANHSATAKTELYVSSYSPQGSNFCPADRTVHMPHQFMLSLRTALSTSGKSHGPVYHSLSHLDDSYWDIS